MLNECWCDRYIHRVGRTARAGKSGRSITLVGEKGRGVLLAVMKSHEESKRGTGDAASRQLARSSVMKSRQVGLLMMPFVLYGTSKYWEAV